MLFSLFLPILDKEEFGIPNITIRIIFLLILFWAFFNVLPEIFLHMQRKLYSF